MKSSVTNGDSVTGKLAGRVEVSGNSRILFSSTQPHLKRDLQNGQGTTQLCQTDDDLLAAVSCNVLIPTLHWHFSVCVMHDKI